MGCGGQCQDRICFVTSCRAARITVFNGYFVERINRRDWCASASVNPFPYLLKNLHPLFHAAERQPADDVFLQSEVHDGDGHSDEQ